ncbi:thioredoxin domain-containing protein [Tessaracoccus sp. MC1865]|uniref:DsbA family protein n=1 Tax=Tessaracoccus sp. MC1865 TaxID=2760310 RepID=UPI001601ED7B|nr:thioredoxin domain-containing protein [Tessaracoccus sp. MC1865]MBB1484376.1 thioredoxin domain-containing protein [Tessaracoccus sp. MC1865]QTO38516.1 thioredoxin domain-containing protein [Tessaracoccus sp. MC1865]
MANNSNLSKRAALRQAQEMDERNKRNKRIMGFGFGLAALVVVVVLAIVIVQAIGNRTSVAEEQLTPPAATEGYGIPLEGNAPSADKPHLVLWEDYQCPACASFHATLGPIVDQLVADGSITTEIRTAHFLDQAREDGPSSRTAVAAAAAAEVGAFEDFHRVAFDFQDTGYTDQVLRNDIPQAAGITGEDLTRYVELYNSRSFQEWVDNADQKFLDDAVDATPAYVVSGQRLDLGSIEPTTEGFLRAVTAAWEEGGKEIDVKPEPYQR